MPKLSGFRSLAPHDTGQRQHLETAENFSFEIENRAACVTCAARADG
jgi:hypothetical protein